MKNNKTKSNMKVLIFDENSKTLNLETCVNVVGDQIESESGVYYLSDAKRYVDEWNGSIYYLFNVDLPVKVEAANLKTLRRSNALQRIFDYDKGKQLDIFKLIPYIIIILMVLF